jgi:hypothetical protein
MNAEIKNVPRLGKLCPNPPCKAAIADGTDCQSVRAHFGAINPRRPR